MSGPRTLLLVALCVLTAHRVTAAHYGTDPVAPASAVPMLRIANQAPLCPERSTTCTETTGTTQGYPVADGDHITIEWTNQPNAITGIIESDHLYLPITSTNGNSTPVTFELELGNPASPAVVVLYGGTRHHVALQPNAWQGVTLYNPDERVIYLRLDTPAPTRPANSRPN